MGMTAGQPGQVEDGGACLPDTRRQADANDIVLVILKRLKQFDDSQQLLAPRQIKAFLRIAGTLDIEHERIEVDRRVQQQ